MSANQAQHIIDNHADEMDDPIAFAMLRLCVAVVHPQAHAIKNWNHPINPRRAA